MAEPANKIPELLKWDDATMTTGAVLIDEQHRELIAKINELYRAHQAGATAEDIKAIIKFLGEFAKKHFAYEEGLMEKFNCPVKQTNCLAHARFLNDYQELSSSFSLDQDVDQAASDIERMMARWLAAHICKIDIALRDMPRA